jgi:biopolymer transport protein ExbD
MAARTFVALDMPVSLGVGHIETSPFPINLQDFYSISIATDEDQPFRDDCLPYSVIKTRWVLYSQGKVAAKWNVHWWRDAKDESNEPISGSFLGFFYSEKAVYRLTVEVVSDADCLNSRHPRIVISAGKTKYEGYADSLFWLSLTLVGSGISLLLLQWPIKQAKSVDQSPTHHVRWAQQLPLPKKFSGLPSFGLTATLTILIVAAPYWVLYFWLIPESHGIKVYLAKTPPALPWISPLVVRIKFVRQGASPDLYLNSNRISWADLGTTLQDSLKSRPEWAAYVEADPDVDWQHVADVMDISRNAHAKVVLLTTPSRDER